MTKRILFIQHYETELVDTAWQHLGALGFEQVGMKPFKGEQLPDTLDDFAGIVIYGGSQNVTELERYPFLKDEIALVLRAIDHGIPVLGICLGGQLISHALGGTVWRREPQECEFGFYALTPTEAAKSWLPSPFYAVQAHYEEFSVPRNAVHLATSARFPNQAFRFGHTVYALQFHPETDREIFEDWQRADWAMYGIAGAQTKEEQDALVEQHSEAQTIWFKAFLESLFVA